MSEHSVQRNYPPKERQRRYASAAATCQNAAVDNALIGVLDQQERATLQEAAKIMNKLHLHGIKTIRLAKGKFV